MVQCSGAWGSGFQHFVVFGLQAGGLEMSKLVRAVVSSKLQWQWSLSWLWRR